MAAASVCVPTVSPSCLLPLWEAPQDQQVGLTQSPFKLLLPSGVLECEILCAPLRAESLFPTVVWLSYKQALLAFKAKHSGGSSFRCRTHRLGSPMWGSDRSILGQNLCNYDYPPVCGPPTRECGF